MNPTLVATVVGGAVALIVALVGLLPNVGRLRRLERVVDVMAKIEDDEGRARMLAIRDKIIAGLEPKRFSFRFGWLGLGSATFGYALILLGLWHSATTGHQDGLSLTLTVVGGVIEVAGVVIFIAHSIRSMVRRR